MCANDEPERQREHIVIARSRRGIAPVRRRDGVRPVVVLRGVRAIHAGAFERLPAIHAKRIAGES
jgi:hypothetical protein